MACLLYLLLRRLEVVALSAAGAGRVPALLLHREQVVRALQHCQPAGVILQDNVVVFHRLAHLDQLEEPAALETHNFFSSSHQFQFVTSISVRPINFSSSHQFQFVTSISVLYVNFSSSNQFQFVTSISVRHINFSSSHHF